jgi:hypothetical protein
MIRADLADQTVVGDAPSIAQEHIPVTPADRYKRHGHFPGLILVENNPALATRLERALFDGHFEVLLVSDDAVPNSLFEQQYPAFESAGLVVIYSCAALNSQVKRRLVEMAGERFFDMSNLRKSGSETDARQKLVSALHSFKSVEDKADPNKSK